MSFAKNISKYIGKNIIKNLCVKCIKYFLIMVKKSTTDAIKTSTSNRATKKTAESIGDLIGNNIANKITKNSLKNNS